MAANLPYGVKLDRYDYPIFSVIPDITAVLHLVRRHLRLPQGTHIELIHLGDHERSYLYKVEAGEVRAAFRVVLPIHPRAAESEIATMRFLRQEVSDER